MFVTVFDSIATANPPYSGAQTEATEFMLRLEGLSAGVRNRIQSIYSRSGIDRRFTCVPDYLRAFPDFEFFPRNPSLEPAPTTGARNQIYREWAPKIACEAASTALAEAACPAGEITHLIVVSCTGFYAPGVDFHLIRNLGLRPDVARTMIGFMGCCAAFNGLKAADAICRSTADARVLLVCVELCTLHFRLDDSLEAAVVNSLFGDGAAAAVLSSVTPNAGDGRLSIADSKSVIDGDSMDDMTWDIGDKGFAMTLSPRIPGIIAKHLGQYVDDMLAHNDLQRSDIGYWAIHPGGRQIVDRAADVLSLPACAMEDSYGVLREYGNMSSPTILFILRRLLQRRAAAKAANVPAPKSAIAMGFGPGLTIEGCVLREI